MLVFDGEIKCSSFDVTDWSDYLYDQSLSLVVKLPCHWVESKMPLDFRSPTQMAESRARNQAIIDAGEE